MSEERRHRAELEDELDELRRHIEDGHKLEVSDQNRQLESELVRARGDLEDMRMQLQDAEGRCRTVQVLPYQMSQPVSRGTHPLLSFSLDTSVIELAMMISSFLF